MKTYNVLIRISGNPAEIKKQIENFLVEFEEEIEPGNWDKYSSNNGNMNIKVTANDN